MHKTVGDSITLAFLTALLAGLFPATRVAADDTDLQFFETEIRPLLTEHCQECHGPAKQESSLRLDSRSAILQGGDRGPAIVPGQPDLSLLMAAVRQTGDLQMPPDRHLNTGQIDRLAHWIHRGAPWPADPAVPTDERAELQRRHWAFQPVSDPPLPSVQNETWVATPIDRFVLSRLESSGLSPSPPAERRSLIRRVTYDLTGLPPTAEQMEAFANDRSPDAYERLVDRLLASPQYGQHWARHWLDVARYADTKGYVYAREERFWVHAPAYRDWIVRAFNADLPYDRFLLLQIAADQAPSTERTDLAAMGFLTLGRRFLGVTHDIIDDRIDVVTRGTMGLTVACARCHDHKYDPIPTSDYYALHGVFLNSREQRARLTSPEDRSEAYAAFQQELDKRQSELDTTLLAKRTEASDRVRHRVTDYLVAQTELSKYPEEGFDQLLSTSDVIPTFVRRWEAWLASTDRRHDPVFLPWRRFSELSADELSAQSPALVNELRAPDLGVNPLVLEALVPAPATMREVAQRYGQLLEQIDRSWRDACEAARQNGRPAPDRLESPEAEALRQVLYRADSPCVVPDEGIVSIEGFFDTGTCQALWMLQGEVDRWLIQSPIAPPEAVYLTDRATMRPARIFRRGNPANRGAEVSQHFVSVVAGENPPPFSHGSGRLELAQAIIDPANPLTARVWVNRVWQHHFGNGLVRTTSDFGMRAEPPSHPELLDWLAKRFTANGWSTKRLHRMVLLSSTYQQQSGVTGTDAARASELDPENRLLWRMNTRRLAFEEFRDSLLAVTSRLDLSMGGRAADLFASDGLTHQRRTIYGLVDRQFLPPTLRIFDFANPDLHVPVRSETTVPQQALFALNHPFMVHHARALAARSLDASLKPPAADSHATDDATRIRRLFRLAYGREPTPQQLDLAQGFLSAVRQDVHSGPPVAARSWQYGYGQLDEPNMRLTQFHPLPHFTGSAWQGSSQWPDPELGWVQITAQGGHPGNDLQHVAVRRWTAPAAGTYRVKSMAKHEVPQGNGIRCTIIAGRQGLLASHVIHHRSQEIDVASIELQAGETLDFVVDIYGDLGYDQHLWSPTISLVTPGDQLAIEAEGSTREWEAERDFAGPVPVVLDGWEQLAQVLLMSNEFLFVD
ncbi:MAG: DUF1553 domain-containing protein [Pirellulales bacterium]